MKIEAATRLLTAIPEWEKPCWLVAITKTTGISEAECKQVMRESGWDGKTFGAQAEAAFQAMKKILGHKPRLDLSVKGKTPKQFGASGPAGKGLVFTKDHVMPWVNGIVSNFNGYGDDPITFIMFVE